jgi:hypothetical protein
LKPGILAIVALVGAQVAPVRPLTVDRVGWLQGCWRSSQGQSIVEEQWMAPGGGSMIGMSRTVRGRQTTAYEFVLITEQEGRLAYRAHPSGQAPATFLSTEATEARVVFEDPQHDFPQRVGYRREGTDLVHAWIEGTSSGRTRRVEFPYRRVACEPPRSVTR